MAFSSSTARTFKPRDQRLEANPADRNYVRFAAEGVRTLMHGAQFGNVSLSGMRLISRQPSRAQVGECVEMQFSLPGSRIELKTRALIIRRVNEFEFAVAFLDFSSTKRRLLQTALDDYFRYLRATPTARRLKKFAAWIHDHRQGLMIAAAGLVAFASAFSWIYYSSDEYNGRRLKAWGKQYPKQYDWDYYNKIPKR